MQGTHFGPFIHSSSISDLVMKDMLALGLSESRIAEMIRIDISDWFFVEDVLRYLYLTYGDKMVMASPCVNGNYSNGVRFHRVQNNGHESTTQFLGSGATVDIIDMIGAAVDSATDETTAANMVRARAAVDAYERDAASDINAPATAESRRLNVRLSGRAKPIDSTVADDDLDSQFKQLGAGTYRLNLDVVPDGESKVTIIISFHDEGATAIGTNCCPPTYYRQLRFYVKPCHSSHVFDMYATIQDQSSKKKSDKLVIRVCDKYGEWNKYSAIPSRKLNTIYIPEEVTTRIKTDISAFLAAKSEYETYGIPYKKTYLLTGVPGSGKTSLVKALCNEFGLNLNILAINSDMDNSSVTQAFRHVKTEDTALLIEDIDCLFDGRSSKGKENSQFTFSNLINLLDGVMYKVGLITFITTNHPEMMDKALLRQGRIDTVVEMNYPRKRDVRSMMMDMLKTRIPCVDARSAEFDKFYALIEKRKITMAALVLFVFRHRESYAEHIDELLDGDDFIRRVTGGSADEKVLYN